MAFLDRTFCASLNCTNQCGRKMTDDEKKLLATLPICEQWVSTAYFCEPEKKHAE